MRRNLSPRVRFEVLKRDHMTCRYCGKSAPNVELVVDHVIPVAAGGTDDPSNLVTACVECNSGKSSGLLEEGQRASITAALVEDATRQAETMRAYREAQESFERETNRLMARVWDHWIAVFDGEKTDTGWTSPFGFPHDETVRRFLVTLPLADILHAIDMAHWRYKNPSPERGQMERWEVRKYFNAVCGRMVRELTAAPPQPPEPEPAPKPAPIEMRRAEIVLTDHRGAGGWHHVGHVVHDIYDAMNTAWSR